MALWRKCHTNNVKDFVKMKTNSKVKKLVKSKHFADEKKNQAYINSESKRDG